MDNKEKIEFVNNILKQKNVTFLDFKIRISEIKDIETGYTLIYTIVHYGLENDKRLTKHNLTGFTSVNVSKLTEEEVIKATYIAILQKLRHEAAELFKVNGEDVFNEHFPRNNYGADFPMIESIIG